MASNYHECKEKNYICEICKKKYCEKCYDLVHELWGYDEFLCPKCYNKELIRLLENLKSEKGSILFLLIAITISYILGIILWANGHPFIGIFLIGWGWFPQGNRWAYERTKYELETFGPEYNTYIDDYGNVHSSPTLPSRYFILVLIVAIIGLISTPILFLKNFFYHMKIKNEINKISKFVLSENELNNIMNAMK